VPVDADNDNCLELESKLVNLYESIDPRPSCVLFRVADEETESWFIAITRAIKQAYAKADLNKIPRDPPDSIIGAGECLALVPGRNPKECMGADRTSFILVLLEISITI
jgi:hypothetical protein